MSSGMNLVSASAHLGSAPSDLTQSDYTPNELRQLVLDYLSHSCFADTAAAFANEIDDMNRDAALAEHSKNDKRKQGAREDALSVPTTLSDDQLQDQRRRKDLREHILSGRVVRAMEMLHEHYPAVLDKARRRPTLLSNDMDDLFVPNYLPDLEALSSESRWGPHSLSLDPTILSLNLQSQAFVEVIRSAASSVGSVSSPTSSGVFSAATPSDAMSNSTSSIVSTRTSNMLQAITLSQALHSAVRELPAGLVREEWERQCVNVSALMAYKNLDECPTKGFLEQSRRVVLAELVNAAIMRYAHDQTTMPLVTLAVRQTTTVWSALAEWKVQFPPLPPGQAKDKSKPKTYPRFDLATYLEEQDSASSMIVEREGR